MATRRAPEAPTVPAGPAAEAWGLFLGMFFAQQGTLAEVAAGHGLTFMHAKALMMLDPDAPPPMRSLAEGLRCDPSNVTGIVDRLEQRGFVERRADVVDRRVKVLALTASGRRVREEVRQALFAPPAPLAALSARDQDALCRLVRKAVQASPGHLVDPPGSPLSLVQRHPA